MIMTTIQKIIRIGSSKGVTLPAKQLKALGVDVNDEIEITVRKRTDITNRQTIDVARSIVDKYSKDFENLAGR